VCGQHSGELLGAQLLGADRVTFGCDQPRFAAFSSASARLSFFKASNRSGANSHAEGKKESKNAARNETLITTSVGMCRSLIPSLYHLSCSILGQNLERSVQDGTCWQS
jgi:hypothetical protein